LSYYQCIVSPLSRAHAPQKALASEGPLSEHIDDTADNDSDVSRSAPTMRTYPGMSPFKKTKIRKLHVLPFINLCDGRRRPGEGFGFSCRLGCKWGCHRIWIVRLSITLVDVSRVDLFFVVM
jgi:hypothetical protein